MSTVTVGAPRNDRRPVRGVVGPRSPREAALRSQEAALALIPVLWRVVAGPPGSPAFETTLESPNRLERIGISCHKGGG